MLESHRCSPVLAACRLVLAEAGRLLKELEAPEGDALTIATVSASEIDEPQSGPPLPILDLRSPIAA